ncbi:tail protein X [Paracoccus sp. PXZ]|uniref:tail protein X n=1 Tax=Paracoccus sp. MKU1 TaxID=1745182 RepID=UPI00071907DD|nr:tail protein X [Paracoccus sp. MKU1]KRW95455.1 phage tail protein [Paracoccus sp. MKU1]
MFTIYRTFYGDMLDAICNTRLGSERHVPEGLEVGPGLAVFGPVYPAGVVITLPEISEPVAAGLIRLWEQT